MQNKHKNEKGSLLVEIIAVLGLIALITPILFHQIARRNEEVIDIQIATEMRAVKDAVSAYIQANERSLASNCGLIKNNKYIASSGEETACGISVTSAKLGEFFAGDSDILNEYSYRFYGYTVKQGTDSYRPVIYAIIVANENMETLRRAAKVASLIGLEGGVFYGGSVKGMQGVWESEESGISENTVVVTTSFDDMTNSAILKDISFSHMQASGSVQAPILATEKLGVKGLFVVSNDGENCILNYNNDSVSIKGTSTSCKPIFEANPDTKKVYLNGETLEVSSALKLEGPIESGISTETSAETNSCTAETKADCEKVSNCVWVSSCSKNTTKESCSQASCTWNETTQKCSGSAKGKCRAEYLLNPSETSLVEDIKLISRGGVKLSEVLPNWILKSTVHKKFDETNLSDWNISIPSCPHAYTPAMIVLSSNLQGNLLSVNTKAIADAIRADDAGKIKPSADFSGNYQENKVSVDGSIRFYLTNNSSSSEGIATGTSGNWTITPQYWIRTSGENDGYWESVPTSLRKGLSAVIQTYCIANTVIFKNKTECENAGYTWSNGACN